MNIQRAFSGSQRMWKGTILPALSEYIRIPNISPHFDSDWKENGHMDRAVDLLVGWVEAQPIPNLTVKKLELEGRTPVIFMELPATDDNLGTVLMYGHLDKQPELTGWREGLSPWKPVQAGDNLYGRGGADDGYSTFAAVAALMLLLEQDLPHGRIVILIEASEESASPDLPVYVETFAEQIGTPDLIICLDSGCGNYDQLWMTTSLRGVVAGNLTVRILREGVHSGSASGIVPDSFRIARLLLSRLEDENGVVRDHTLLLPLKVTIPADRLEQADRTARVLGQAILDEFPWVESAWPHDDENGFPELLLRRTWDPALTVIGAAGFPPSLAQAGNVLRPYTTLRLSMRIPPTADSRKCAEAMKAMLEYSAPDGAEVTFAPDQMADGWNAPPLAPWLKKSMNEASLAFFGAEAMSWGEGGSIPFMGMLSERFPEAQFVVTGLLGPGSNAHGPNECLHIPTGMKLTAAIAKIIADHAASAR